MSYSTYKTGLQFDNKTSMAVVWGSITYNSDHFQPSSLGSFFSNLQRTENGKLVTFSGDMNIPSQTYAGQSIEIYENWGQAPIKVVLKFSDGHVIAFEDLQRRAYEETPEPQPVSISQTKGSDPLINMSVAFWTRRDAAIKAYYAYGLVTYTLREDSETARWMGLLPNRDTTRLNQITLPGTHDTGTSPLSGNARCQSMSLRQQLDAGVRFIDIRLELMGTDPTRLQIYHGPSGTGLFFAEDVVAVCTAFLADNPTETVVMLLSQNRNALDDAFDAVAVATGGPLSSVIFTQRMAGLVNRNPIFRRDPSIPTLKDAAGHIVLVTRYHDGSGVELRNGPDDDHKRFTENGVTFDIQDVYGYGFPDWNILSDAAKREKVDKKWGFVAQSLSDAYAETNAAVWWINYTSASGPPTILNPVDFAQGIDGRDGINTRLAHYLAAAPKGYYGTVLMDYPEFPDDGKVIRQLIDSNF